ncbi:MAG TPA: hypothetical protein VF115_05150 [Acidimicrobiia bacterium]
MSHECLIEGQQEFAAYRLSCVVELLARIPQSDYGTDHTDDGDC